MDDSPSRPSRHPVQHKRNVLLAIGLLAMVVISLLVPLPLKSRAADAIGNMVHAPLFALLTLGAFGLLCLISPLKTGRSAVIRAVIVVVAVFAFGITIEFMQSLSGRRASVHDVISNGLGILAATCLVGSLVLKRQQSAKRRMRRILLVATPLLIVISWWDSVVVLRDVIAIRRDFPLLGSFESTIELERWYFANSEGRLTRQDSTEGRYAMELTVQPGRHPGATLTKFRHNWSAMKTLELDVTLDSNHPQPTVELLVNIVDVHRQDDYRDIFRSEWTLQPGQTTHLRISREQIIPGPGIREFDLAQVKYLDIQLHQPTMKTIIRVDAIRLTM